MGPRTSQDILTVPKGERVLTEMEVSLYGQAALAQWNIWGGRMSLDIPPQSLLSQYTSEKRKTSLQRTRWLAPLYRGQDGCMALFYRGQDGWPLALYRGGCPLSTEDKMAGPSLQRTRWPAPLYRGGCPLSTEDKMAGPSLQRRMSPLYRGQDGWPQSALLFGSCLGTHGCLGSGRLRPAVGQLPVVGHRKHVG